MKACWCIAVVMMPTSLKNRKDTVIVFLRDIEWAQEEVRNPKPVVENEVSGMYENSTLAQGNKSNWKRRELDSVKADHDSGVSAMYEKSILADGVKSDKNNSEFDPDNANSENGVSAMYDNSILADGVKSNKKNSEFNSGNADSEKGVVEDGVKSDPKNSDFNSGNADSENGVSALYKNSILAEGIKSSPQNSEIKSAMYEKSILADGVKSDKKNSEFDPGYADPENGASAVYENSILAEAIKSNPKKSEFDAGNADSQNGESLMYENGVLEDGVQYDPKNSEFNSCNADENGVSALYENSILAEGIKSNKKNSEFNPDDANSENGVSAMYDNSILADGVKSNEKNSEFNSGNADSENGVLEDEVQSDPKNSEFNSGYADSENGVSALDKERILAEGIKSDPQNSEIKSGNKVSDNCGLVLFENSILAEVKSNPGNSELDSEISKFEEEMDESFADRIVDSENCESVMYVNSILAEGAKSNQENSELDSELSEFKEEMDDSFADPDYKIESEADDSSDDEIVEDSDLESDNSSIIYPALLISKSQSCINPGQFYIPEMSMAVESTDTSRDKLQGCITHEKLIAVESMDIDRDESQSVITCAMHIATESTDTESQESESGITSEIPMASEITDTVGDESQGGITCEMSVSTERDKSKGGITPEMPMASESTEVIRNKSQGDAKSKMDKNTSFSFEQPFEREKPLTNDKIQRCVKYHKIFTKKLVKANNTESKSGEANTESTTGREYDLVHACLYCRKLRTNIQTHLFNVHSHEQEVKEITKLEKTKEQYSSLEDKKKIEKMIMRQKNILRNKGDNLHNINVCNSKEGELILSRRRSGDFDSSVYGGCPECGEWMILKDNYTKHRQVCPGASSIPLSSAIVQAMIFKGEIGQNACKELSEVFKSMQKDEIGLTAMKDNLILALGEIYFFSNIRNKIKRKNYASFRMRLGARLLILLRKEIDNSEASMSECLVVENFDKVVKCALLACEKNSDDELKHPSVALKLSDDLNKMVDAKVALAAKSRNEVERKEGKLFKSLLGREWHLKVKKQAVVLLEERQFNKNAALPDPHDIALLAEFLINQLKAIRFDIDIETYRQVVILTQARLLLYNRRRPGELSALEINTYNRRSTSVNETDLSLREELTPLEKKLVKSQDLLETRGKCGNKVPLILPEEVKEPLKYLTDSKIREEVGIKDRVHVFASTGDEPMRAGTSLDVVKYQAKLRYPERILATNLRKHTATISQVMGLKDSELRWLVNHLGHTEKVHLQNYRATSGLIERIDIAKLMLIQEKNVVGKFAGLKLSEINFDDIDDEQEKDITQTAQAAVTDNSCDDGFDGVEESQEMAEELEADEVEAEEMPTVKKLVIKKKKAVAVKRITWSREELAEVNLYFKNFLDLSSKKTCPGMKDCLSAIANSRAKGGQLCRRHWETIKKKVSHLRENVRKEQNKK